MTSTIDPNKLFFWCRIPANELERSHEKKVDIKILKTKKAVYQWVAEDMISEVIDNNQKNKLTRWILPCGPTGQYDYFIDKVNEQNISLKKLHIFHMDDMLDWEGRPLPLDHPFSYEGWMRRNFYGRLNKKLVPPESQRHFPSIHNLDAISEAIKEVGGVDTTYGGIGYRGHIAYNEPAHSPWYTVTNEQYKNSKTRILHLNEDTLIALSQRHFGGCSHAVPPMAITMGMRDLLSAKRIRLVSETGSWKQTVIRVLLFGPQTIEYPVTFVQGHPNVLVVVDSATARPPLGS